MYYVEQNKTGGGHFLGWTQKSQSGCRKVVPRAGNEQWKWGQHPQQGHQTCCAPTVQTDTLKGIIFLLPFCVCVCIWVCLYAQQRGHWAASSLLHWPASLHQPTYPSKEAVIRTLLQTCTSRRDEGKSAAALFVKLDSRLSLSWQSRQVYYSRMSSLDFSNLISHLPFTAETPGGLEVPFWVSRSDSEFLEFPFDSLLFQVALTSTESPVISSRRDQSWHHPHRKYMIADVPG